MEVKVGQVWKSNLTGLEYTVKAVHDHQISVLKPVVSSIDRVAFDGGIFEMIKDVEPQLSDLEIVQRALEKMDAQLVWVGDYASVIAQGKAMIDGGIQDVITWAKQTVGVE